jgi:hypothetical protein
VKTAAEPSAAETTAMETATVETATVETATVETATAMCCLGGLRLGQDEDACQSGCRKAQAARCVDALHVAYSFFCAAAVSAPVQKDRHAPLHAIGREMKSGLGPVAAYRRAQLR